MKLGNIAYLSTVIVLASSFSLAQTGPAKPATGTEARSIEDLNFRGSDAAMPPFADSLGGANSSFRNSLLSKGVALRDISTVLYSENVLASPVAADSQSYVGRRAFQNVMSNPILAWDMRQFGLSHAQFNLSGVWNWASWEPAGPKAFDLWTLCIYKEFARDRVEVKAGYNSNELEFVGMQVPWFGAQ